MTSDRRLTGFRRADGRVGVRNLLLVLPVGQCANELAVRCASEIPEAFPLLHTQPCAHLGEDNLAAGRCLVGLGRNPNVAAVLVLGIGCDALSASEIAEDIAASGKPVGCFTVEFCGRWESAVERGRAWLREQSASLGREGRFEMAASDVVLAVKCGGSDATSALAGNPASGKAVDHLIDKGGTAIFSETTELIGAEHLLMRRAATPETREEIGRVVGETERRIRATGCLRGSPPSLGRTRGASRRCR